MGKRISDTGPDVESSEKKSKSSELETKIRVMPISRAKASRKKKIVRNSSKRTEAPEAIVDPRSSKSQRVDLDLESTEPKEKKVTRRARKPRAAKVKVLAKVVTLPEPGTDSVKVAEVVSPSQIAIKREIVKKQKDGSYHVTITDDTRVKHFFSEEDPNGAPIASVGYLGDSNDLVIELNSKNIVLKSETRGEADNIFIQYKSDDTTNAKQSQDPLNNDLHLQGTFFAKQSIQIAGISVVFDKTADLQSPLIHASARTITHYGELKFEDIQLNCVEFNDKPGSAISGAGLLLKAHKATFNGLIDLSREAVYLVKEKCHFGSSFSHSCSGNVFLAQEFSPTGEALKPTEEFTVENGAIIVTTGFFYGSVKSTKISGKMDGARLEIAAQQADLTETAILKGQQLSVDSQELTVEAQCDFSEKAQFKAKNDLTLGEKCCLLGGAEYQFQTDKHFSCAAQLKEGAQATVKAKSAEFTKAADVQLKNDLIVNADGLKVLGKLSCSKFKIKVNDLDLERSAIISVDEIIAAIGKLYSRAVVKAKREIGLKITGRFLLEDGNWHSDKIIIQASQGESRAEMTGDTLLFIEVQNDLTLHEDALLKSNQLVKVLANDVYTRAYFSCANGPVEVAVNRIFVNGFSSFDCLANVVHTYKGSIRAKDVKIIAAVFLSLPGCTIWASNSLQVSGLIVIKLGDHTDAFYKVNNAILEVDYGIHTPGIQWIKSLLVDFKNGEFNLLTSLFQKNSLNNITLSSVVSSIPSAVSHILTVLKFLVPSVGSVLNMIYQSIMIGYNLSNIIVTLQELRTRYGRDQLMLREIIPVLVGMKDIALGMYHMYTCIPQLERQLEEIASQGIGMGELTYDGLVSFAKTLPVIMGPSSTSSSLFSSRGGAEFSGIVTRNDYATHRSQASLQAAFTVNEFFGTLQDNGVTYAYSMSSTGRQMHQGGKRTVNQLYIELSDTLSQAENSYMQAQFAVVKAHGFEQSGQVEFAKSQLTFTEHNVSATGEFNTGEGSQYRSVTTTNAGKFSAAGTDLNIDDLKTTATGKTAFRRSSRLAAKRVKVDGQQTATDSVLQVDDYEQAAGSQASLDNCSVEIKRAKVSGTLDGTQIDYQGESLQQGAGSSVALTNSNITLSEKHSVDANAEFLLADSRYNSATTSNAGQFSAAGSEVLIETLQTTATGKTAFRRSSRLAAKRVKVDGQQTATDSVLQVDDYEQAAGSQASLDNCSVEIKRAKVSGTLDGTQIDYQGESLQQGAGSSVALANSNVTLSEKHSVDANAEFLLADSRYNSATTSNAGQFSAAGSEVLIETLQTTATGKTAFRRSSRLAAKRVKVDGQQTATDSVLQVDDYEQAAGSQASLDNCSVEIKRAKVSGTLAGSQVEYQGEDLFQGQQSKVSLIQANVILSGDHTTEKNSTLVLHDVYERAKNIVVQSTADIADSHLQASENVTFTESSKLDATQTLVQGQNIKVAGEATVSTVVALEAEQKVELSPNSLVKGDGHLNVQGAATVLDGAVRNNSFHVENETFQDANALLAGTGKYANIQPQSALSVKTGQAVNLDQKINRDIDVGLTASSINVNANAKTKGNLLLDATQGDINVNADLTSAKNVVLEAEKGGINDNNHKINAGETAVLNAEKDINLIRAHVQGDEVYADSRTGTVKNYAGTVESDTYTQVTAAKDIQNVTEHVYRNGQYGYDRATMTGGSGAGHDDVGFVAHAQNQVVNSAATMGARNGGSAQITGVKGVTANSQTHEYEVSRKQHRKWNGKKWEEIITATHVERPVFTGQQVQVASPEGAVHTEGAQFNTNSGATVVAKKNVELLEVIGVTTVESHKRGAFGLNHKDHSESHQTSTPTQLVNSAPGNVVVQSYEGDVIGTGAVISNPQGHTHLEGKNVNFSKTILEHEIHDRETSLSFAVLGFTLFGQPKPPALNADPLLDQVDQLAQSDNAGELALNTANTAIQGVNAVNTLRQAAEQGQMIAAIAERAGVPLSNPALSATLQKTTTDSYYQTAGPGSIDSGTLTVVGSESATFAGTDITVIGDAIMQTPVLNLSGVTLAESFKAQNHSVTLSTANHPGGVDVGVAGAKTTSEGVTHQNQQVQIGGNLAVDVGTANLTSTNVSTNSLTGKIGTLNLQTEVDSFASKSISGSASTTGQMSYQKTRAEGTSVGTATTLSVNQAIDDQFQVDTVNLNGAKILSSDDNNLNANYVNASDVHTSTSAKSVGFSGNFKDWTSKQPQQSAAIATAQIGLENSSSTSVQHSVIHGNKGTNLDNATVNGGVHTADANGAEVLSQSQHSYQVILPKLDQDGRDKLVKPLQKPETPDHSPLPILEKIKNDLGLKSTEATESEVQKCWKLSDMVYRADNTEGNFGKATLLDSFTDPATGLIVGVFQEGADDRIYIGFAGTNGFFALMRDDFDIARGKIPRSVENAQNFVAQQVEQWSSQGYSIVFTGHSRGAADASYFTSLYPNSTAIVFDNPVLTHAGTDFSKVYSFQSTPNVVNQLPTLKPLTINSSQVIQLLPTGVDQVVDGATQILAGNSSNGANLLLLAGDTLFSHKLGFIRERLDKTLEQGEEYTLTKQ